MRLWMIVLLASVGIARAEPPPVLLDADAQDLLARGEITHDQHVGGAAAALLFGFGTGQIAQRRWHDGGWIFTVGDTLAGAGLFVGMLANIQTCPGHDCRAQTPPILIGSLIALVGLRVWQTADAIIVPPRHNRRVRELRARLNASAGGLALAF